VNILDEIRNDAQGLALLKDWLGEGGKTVDPVQADIRAHVCYNGNNGEPCPRNKEPNWWERVKSAIALTIRDQLELKSRMQLKVHREESIHMCSACGCCLKLKVWTPIEHIKSHLSVEQFNRTVPYCWMRKEIGGSS
jgi:hypothetical protein